MEFLENINKLEKINFFDKEEWDEDAPSDLIPVEINKLYESRGEYFNSICKEIGVQSAIKTSSDYRDKNKIVSNNFIYGEVVR